MFRLFRKSTQSKCKNLANDNSKDFLKRSSDRALGIIQVIASTATCFTVIKMLNEKNQLYKHQIISNSDDYEETNRNAKDFSMDKGAVVQQIAQIAQIAGAIAAVVTSAVTWVTVQEMKNERNQLYKPQMIFERSYYSDDYERNILGLWDAKDLADHIYYGTGNYPSLETTIYNIGSGAALEIEINFMLDSYEEYVEAIGRYFKNGTIIANNSGFTIHYNKITRHHFVDTRNCIIRKPFLLSGESMDIAFPKEISELLYCLNYCTLGDYSWEPKVRVQISFLDLQGIRYCIDYELVIKMVISDSKQGDKYFHVDYKVEQEYLADEKYKEYEEYYQK